MTAWMGLMALMLVCRLAAFFREGPSGAWPIALVVVLQILAAFSWAVMTPVWCVWLVITLLAHVWCVWRETSEIEDSQWANFSARAEGERRRVRAYARRTEGRLISLAVMLGGAAAAAWWSPPVAASPARLAWDQLQSIVGAAQRQMSLEHASVWAFCLLMALSESNRLVAWALRVSRLQPASDDRAKLVHGADLIGILERFLVFIVVAFQAFNAAAFILAAKGLVRFHETKEPETASYVLVGTLLSSVLAFVWAILAMWLTGKI